MDPETQAAGNADARNHFADEYTPASDAELRETARRWANANNLADVYAAREILALRAALAEARRERDEERRVHSEAEAELGNRSEDAYRKRDAAEASVHALTEELRLLRIEWENACERDRAANALRISAEKDRLREISTGLAKFAQHHHTCDSLLMLTADPPPRRPCTCGLDAARAALASSTAPAPDGAKQ